MPLGPAVKSGTRCRDVGPYHDVSNSGTLGTSTGSRKMGAAVMDRLLDGVPEKVSGGDMELVLGVSMTPTSVRLALVEGEEADGVIVDHDVFDINAAHGSAASRASDEVIAAVLGTQESAIAAGHHLVSTGVTWTDRAQAAVLREALVDRGMDGVLMVSQLQAAAALAQAIGRAVGYDKTALMFIERETATLAVVKTAEGSVAKVLSKNLHDGDAIPVVAEMFADRDVQQSAAEALFVVGAGADVTAVKARLADLVAVPVIAPEEPQLALARGAALASANAPRYDACTVGLAYSHDPDGTTAQSIAAADLVQHDDALPDAADIADPDAPEPSKPFLLVGSALTAIFIAGMIALTVAVAVTVRPTADQGSNAMPVHHPGTAAPPPTTAKQTPKMVPAPAPAAPPSAAIAARLKVLPAPPPVVVRNIAPAPAAPPLAPAASPPVVVPPAPPPAMQWPAPWLPPILQPPLYYSPQSPQWYPGRTGPPRGHGGSRYGHDGGD